MNKYSVYIFLSLLIIQLLITFYSQTYLLTDDLYRLILGSQMTDRQFDDYLEFVRKWQWVSYLFIPVALLLRISFTWICLKAGSFITERFAFISKPDLSRKKLFLYYLLTILACVQGIYLKLT